MFVPVPTEEQIARCLLEQELTKHQKSSPAWLVTLGWCDWQWEMELLKGNAGVTYPAPATTPDVPAYAEKRTAGSLRTMNP